MQDFVDRAQLLDVILQPIHLLRIKLLVSVEDVQLGFAFVFLAVELQAEQLNLILQTGHLLIAICLELLHVLVQVLNVVAEAHFEFVHFIGLIILQLLNEANALRQTVNHFFELFCVEFYWDEIGVGEVLLPLRNNKTLQILQLLQQLVLQGIVDVKGVRAAQVDCYYAL